MEKHEPPLTDQELVKIRERIERDDRVDWLWATIGIWAKWIAAVAVGVTVGWQAFKDIIKAALT